MNKFFPTRIKLIALVALLLLCGGGYAGYALWNLLTTALEGGDATLGVAMKELEDEIKKGTALARAKKQLALAETEQEKITKQVEKYRIDARTAERRIVRYEEEKAKSKQAFDTLLDVAKQAGLSKPSEVTEEDNQKQIQVVGETLTGREVYRLLQTYKQEVSDKDKDIAVQKEEITFVLEMVSEAGEDQQTITQNIDDLKKHIREVERIQERYKNVQRTESLRSSNTELAGLKNSIGELKDTTDHLGAVLDEKREKIGTRSVDSDKFKAGLTGQTAAPKVTDDDRL